MKPSQESVRLKVSQRPRRGSDIVAVKRQNTALILRLVWEHKETTRASLARETGLSRSTVSTIVETLLDQGLLQERGSGVSTRGRKPTILCFNYEARLILGIDLGATHIAVGVINLNGSIKSRRSEVCPVRDEPHVALATLKRLTAEALRESQVREESLLGVGLAVPSPVSMETPTRLSPPSCQSGVISISR